MSEEQQRTQSKLPKIMQNHLTMTTNYTLPVQHLALKERVPIDTKSYRTYSPLNGLIDELEKRKFRIFRWKSELGLGVPKIDIELLCVGELEHIRKTAEELSYASVGAQAPFELQSYRAAWPQRLFAEPCIENGVNTYRFPIAYRLEGTWQTRLRFWPAPTVLLTFSDEPPHRNL